uniref:Peroxidase n=1 Tax=Oryza nivara TaxID=4536 RepID=A0A0E0HWS7_ORYNI
MKLTVAIVCAMATALLAAAPSSAEAGDGELKVGYYDNKCSGVEDIVRSHGCDGSVLLNASDENPRPETAAPVSIGLEGFDILEEIKADLERRCPGVVSCADILIFAARDASSILSNGRVRFDVPAGRLDGVVSSADEAQAELPDPTFTIRQLIDNFARKNFTVEELVVLSGAHSVGDGHCSSFTARLAAPPDQITPSYRNLLNYRCSRGGGADPAVVNNARDEDLATVARFMPAFVGKLRPVSALDNTYYRNNLDKVVNFNSDWQLLTQDEARGHVREYADNAALWDRDFAASLLKLSKLPMPVGSKGEIRNKMFSRGMKLILMVAFQAMSLISISTASLQYNFYGSSCPNAEQTISNIVYGLIDADPSMAPALLRLHFHDCFVMGCDASILLDPTKTNGSPEKTAIPLRGYDAVNKIKAAVEAVCPGKVSCADILAFAARDSVAKSGGFVYPVPAGRRDGNVSSAFSVFSSIPSPFFDAGELVQSFAAKGLTVDDLVALSGAHSIGTAHCSGFKNRLYPTNALAGRVLFTSDAALLTGRNDTAEKVRENAGDLTAWMARFAASMVKMGGIEVLTGARGEVRRFCNNHPTGINDDRDEADATHTTAGDEARATSARRAGGFACMSRVASSQWRSSGARLQFTEVPSTFQVNSAPLSICH